MLLKKLIEKIYNKPLSGQDQMLIIQTISCDSRQLQPNGLFVAINGFKFDGEDFIKQAIGNGACVVAKKGSKRQLKDYVIPDAVCVLDVEDPKIFLRQSALRFYNSPSRQIKTVGITGTNGKTTITYMLENIFKCNQNPSAVIGTINYRIAGKTIPSNNTTPGFLELQKYLRDLADLSIPYCFMEVSSHALEQGRVDGIDFSAAIFTNLTQDHLDYHKTMDAYFKAKALLFENLNSQAPAVINKDDAYAQSLLKLNRGRPVTYAIKQKADVQAVRVEPTLKGTRITINLGGQEMVIQTRFIGEHNVYNILAAIACAWSLGVELSAIRTGIETLGIVPGRLEPVDSTQDFFIFIDYAHTPDGLINVLQALRKVSDQRILVVFGCGGDRDRTKRPLMGKAVCQLADRAFITSDNPRSEDPAAITQEIALGFDKNNYQIIVDRRQAIAAALNEAKAGEIVLIAGKGHENYQIFKDKTVEFNESAIVKELLGLKHVQC